MKMPIDLSLLYLVPEIYVDLNLPTSLVLPPTSLLRKAIESRHGPTLKLPYLGSQRALDLLVLRGAKTFFELYCLGSHMVPQFYSRSTNLQLMHKALTHQRFGILKLFLNSAKIGTSTDLAKFLDVVEPEKTLQVLQLYEVHLAARIGWKCIARVPSADQRIELIRKFETNGSRAASPRSFDPPFLPLYLLFFSLLPSSFSIAPSSSSSSSFAIF